MKTRTAYISAAGYNIFSITTTRDLPFENEQYIQDAKEICKLLIAGIPNVTYQEVLAFLKAFQRNDSMTSYSDEFQRHFERRLKKLNKKSA